MYCYVLMKLEHWKYFVALEHDLGTVARYVEPTPQNFATFSVELTKLFLSACSEVEVVCRLLCARECKGHRTKHMNDFRSALHPRYPHLSQGKVEILSQGIELTPWDKWDSNINPSWWCDHNKVKHRRHEFFEKATLENALNAMAGLYLLLHRYYLPELQKAELTRHNAFFFCDGEPMFGVSACSIT